LLVPAACAWKQLRDLKSAQPIAMEAFVYDQKLGVAVLRGDGSQVLVTTDQAIQILQDALTQATRSSTSRPTTAPVH
jgi:hypothetical protein